MIRGLYTAASGMMAQQRTHDTISNNIANMQTPGFKQDVAALRSFPEMLIHLMDGDGNNGTSVKQIGSLHTGVFVEENFPVFTQGDLSMTNKPGDLAIQSNIQVLVDGEPVAFDASGQAVVNGEVIYQPQAFFTVQGVDGEARYTRDGRFHLDETGQLVNANGELVLDIDGQPIFVPDTLDQVQVSSNGTLVDRTNGDIIAQLFIARVDNPYDLIRDGYGNYRLAEGAAAPVPIGAEDQVVVRQGAIERSNVDAAQSMVDMMTALRMYEANQKVIQSFDQTLEKAVNEIGRI